MATTVNRCLRYYREQHVIPSVIDKQRVEHCIAKLDSYFGRKAAENITNRDVRGYCAKRAKKVGQGTICREVACLISALRFCFEEGLIRSLQPLKRPKRPEALDRWLTLEESENLLKNAGERARLFILIALQTGGRPEAIDDLKWTQVDLDQKLIKFNAEGRSQTNKKRPVVPISDRLVTELSQITNKTGYVLGNNSSTYKGVSGAIKRAGLKGVTRKTLRHTWATWAAQRGVDMWKIAGVLGTSVTTAEKNYAHHCPEYLREAVNY